MKKHFLSFILIALLWPVNIQARTEINLSTVVWIGYSPLYVAVELDLFEPYGVQVTMDVVSDNTQMITALQEGSADAATLTYDEVLINLAKNKADIKIVMPINYSDGGDAIVARQDITSIAQFKGQKIGYNFLTPPDILMSYALAQHGLSEADIEPLNIPADGIQSALESARIVAGATYEPNVSVIRDLAEGKKYHVIFSSKEAPGLITDSLVFNRSFIEAHPAAVKGMIQGYLAGMEYMRTHPDEAAKIISMNIGIPAANVGNDLQTIHNLPLDEMLTVFEESDKTTSFFNSGKLIGNLLVQKKVIQTIPAISATFDDSFVKELLAER
jgi:NitT/TauT family transport system substrate-binding protein